MSDRSQLGRKARNVAEVQGAMFVQPKDIMQSPTPTEARNKKSGLEEKQAEEAEKHSRDNQPRNRVRKRVLKTKGVGRKKKRKPGALP